MPTHTDSRRMRPSDLMLYQEAADLIGRPYSTVKRWANTGRVRKYYGWQTGRMRPYVSASEVRAAAGLQAAERQAQLQLVPEHSLQELRKEVRTVLAQELRALLAALEE